MSAEVHRTSDTRALEFPTVAELREPRAVEDMAQTFLLVIFANGVPVVLAQASEGVFETVPGGQQFQLLSSFSGSREIIHTSFPHSYEALGRLLAGAVFSDGFLEIAGGPEALPQLQQHREFVARLRDEASKLLLPGFQASIGYGIPRSNIYILRKPQGDVSLILEVPYDNSEVRILQRQGEYGDAVELGRIISTRPDDTISLMDPKIVSNLQNTVTDPKGEPVFGPPPEKPHLEIVK